MNKISLTFFLILFYNNLFCQLLVERTTGRPFHITTDQSVIGSPFLFDNWRPGKIILVDGKEFDSVMLKYDLVRNKFYFNRNDSTYELLDDLAEVRIKKSLPSDSSLDIVFMKVTNAQVKELEGNFVELLANGKIILFKKYSKRIEGENVNNGIFSTQKKIVSNNRLWAIVNNHTIPVKLNQHSLDEIISDKKEEIMNYIKTKNLNIKDEKDFIAAINFYNGF